MVSYQGKYVCFISINGDTNALEAVGWTVWSDDSGADWFADCLLDERMKETVWANVDLCGRCGGCGNPGGTRRLVLGKMFDNVCITALKFIDPDAEAVECMKKMAEIRKCDILGNNSSTI